jgi:hypothetical protein
MRRSRVAVRTQVEDGLSLRQRLVRRHLVASAQVGDGGPVAGVHRGGERNVTPRSRTANSFRMFPLPTGPAGGPAAIQSFPDRPGRNKGSAYPELVPEMERGMPYRGQP